MNHSKPEREVPNFIRTLCSDLSETGLQEATDSLKQYFKAIMRVYERLESEGRLEEVIADLRAKQEQEARRALLEDLTFILSYRAAMKTRWRNPDATRPRHS